MLQNISIRYDPVEDRLVLRLTLTSEGGFVEHTLLLTRRICAAWRRDLQAMVDLSAKLPERMDRAAKAVVSSANHQAMSSQVPTRTEPASPLAGPAEHAAVLVTKVTCGRRKDDGRWVLKFALRERAPLAMVLSDQTLHALVDAVSRRVQVADWALPQMPAERTHEERPPAAPLH